MEIFQCKKQQRKRTEETLPWAKASQHSVSNCATKQPSVWMKSGKKIWQWSDCSPYTSNPCYFWPLHELCWQQARRRLRVFLKWPATPKARGRDKLFPGNQDPQQHRRCYHFSSLLTKQRRGWAGQPLTCLICSENPKPATWICFLLFVQPLAY